MLKFLFTHSSLGAGVRPTVYIMFFLDVMIWY